MSKRVIKSLIKKAYKIRINYLIKPSIKSLMNENYEAAAENDKKVIAYISTLSKGGKLNRIKKKTVAKSIIEYVKALNLVALYQKDSMINNQSVKLYSECVLNGVLDQKIFMPYDWCEFVNALLIANARICATETYRKLYNEFVNQYSDVRKARAISQLLMCNTGYIPYKTQVIPLIERFDVTMGKLESRYNAKQNNKNLGLITEYMRNMLFISDMCFVSIDGIEKYAKKYMHIFTCNNVISYKILRLLKQLLTKDRCVCEIEMYLRTIKNNEHEKIDKYTKAINELEAILVEIETGKIQKISYGSKRQSAYAELVQCLEEGESDKKAIFDKIISTEKTYELKINRSSVLDDDVAKNLKILFNVRYIKRKQQYWVQFNEMMQKVASVGTSDIIYFFPGDEYIAFASNILPVLIEAKKRKYLVCPSNTLTFDFSSDDQELNDIARSIYYNKISGVVESNRFRKGCKIDIPNQLIEYDGMNIYQPIYEVVSRWNFSLFMHFEDNAFSRAYVYRNIIIFQNIFSQCEELYSYAVENRKKVKIVHATPHVNVGAAWRIFCEYKNVPETMDFICVRSGYDDYFSLSSEEKTETISALSLTRNLDARTSIWGTKAGFDQFIEENICNIEFFRQKAQKWFAVQRSVAYSENDEDKIKKREEVLELIRKYKRENKRVYLMNGKLIFDLGVKYNKGCVHRDMSHWATHTVNTIKENKDILLLIKPHPHETKKAITMTEEATDTFRDIILTDLSENIIYLEGDLFRNCDLAHYVDVGLTWNSTSTLELAALGVKVIMGDEFGYKDYPLGFIRVNTIEEYEAFLSNPDKYEPDADLTEKAIMFLNYIGSQFVSVKNRYSTTSTNNYNVFESSINERAIDDYIKNGDTDLEKLFNSIDL